VGHVVSSRPGQMGHGSQNVTTVRCPQGWLVVPVGGEKS